MTWQLVFSDWAYMTLHFLSLSLLTAGSGSLVVAPQMHTYLVTKKLWLTDVQFTSSITLAQLAPGPNALFVALLGWNVGVGASSWLGPWIAMITALVATLLPSSIVTLAATRWFHRNRKRPAVQAFKVGMAPISMALLVAMGVLLLAPYPNFKTDWGVWLTAAVTSVLVWKTHRIHMLYFLAIGAVLGMLNLI